MVDEAQAWTAPDLLHAYAFAHEQWMVRSCAGPLWSAAVGLVAGRAIDLDRLDTSGPGAPWELSRRGDLMPALAAPLALAR
jgi:hypothetical protein